MSEKKPPSDPPPTVRQPRRRNPGTPGGLVGAVGAHASPASPPPGGGDEVMRRGGTRRDECNAVGCHTETPPARFMCRPHWFRLPPELRRALLNAYEPGQGTAGKRPAHAWMAAAFEAIAHVARLEQFLAPAEYYAERAKWFAKQAREESIEE